MVRVDGGSVIEMRRVESAGCALLRITGEKSEKEGQEVLGITLFRHGRHGHAAMAEAEGTQVKIRQEQEA